jgi:hypothetical protein
MNRRAQVTRRSRPRGGILFEVMVSIALFAGAGAFALGATRAVFSRLDRLQRDQTALDLARSKLASLEAGLTNLAELREGGIGGLGSIEDLGLDEMSLSIDSPTMWIIEIETERTEFRGLTLVEITVREEHTGPGAEDDATLAGATIRQLVRLRGEDAEEYEEDEMLRDLPGANP